MDEISSEESFSLKEDKDEEDGNFVIDEGISEEHTPIGFPD